METKILILLHALGAAVWAGGHLILSISVLPAALKHKNFEIIEQFESKFERIGIPALILQVITGVRLAMISLPDFSKWFSFENSFAANIAVKFILLILTILLALHARLRLVPGKNLNALSFHIIAVTVIAVLFVVVGVSFRFGGLF